MPTIPFVIQQQQGLNLCWAAVAASVANYRNPAAVFTQCKVAQGLLLLPPGTKCCPDVSPCDEDGPLGPALQFCKVPIGIPHSAPLQPPAIMTQVNAGKVICAGIQWNGGGLHYVVIYGYEPDAVCTLHLADPYFGCSSLPYQTFLTHYTYLGGTWGETIELA